MLRCWQDHYVSLLWDEQCSANRPHCVRTHVGAKICSLLLRYCDAVLTGPVERMHPETWLCGLLRDTAMQC